MIEYYARRFVIQEHHAASLHYDFRLEREGVLKSWAIPKGLSLVAGEKRLAIQVDDHEIQFGSFEGEIPEGRSGAGTIAIWDEGHYALYEWSADRIVVELCGQRIGGTYELVRFPRAGETAWLVFRRTGSPAGRGHAPNA